MRWVVLLLAVAVILPTVCLLWFMTQAVKNVQFATRQLLIDEYSRRLNEQVKAIDKIWEQRTNIPKGITNANVSGIFLSIISDNSRFNGAEGVVIFDQSGNISYPLIESESFTESEQPEGFEKAWNLEFVQKDYKAAWWAYEELSVSLSENAWNYPWRKAILGAARCLLKDGDIKKAKADFEMAGWGGRITPNISTYEASLCAQARVMLAEISKDPNSYVSLSRLVKSAINYDTGSDDFLPMDSGTRIFILNKAIKLVEESPYKNAPETYLHPEQLKKFLLAEQLSANIAQSYQNDSSLKQVSSQDLFKLDTSSDIYVVFKQSENRGFLLLWPASSIKNEFEDFKKTFAGPDVIYRITDNKGLYVSGIEKPDSTPFLKVPLGINLQDWHIELFFANSSVFENAAAKQASVYIWAGVLVIGMILATGGLAGSAISRQVKMNRLKNDFIATVTHELKTPLASMRVLADTLLEGNYKDQQQVTEYLELICKENKRLTGLIDNFLTFSRMERNKQKFDMRLTSPSAIAQAAVEVVKTKFDNRQCQGKVEISENLPDIMADHDAMVTVLVNLLDNACKYSYDNKLIELKVFCEDNNVCFAVKDNGIGMTRRQMRKIFDKFYQADNTLSRKAEGTGLGLSIVKFILDAHNANIQVQSQIEKGSTFIIKIPILKET